MSDSDDENFEPLPVTDIKPIRVIPFEESQSRLIFRSRMVPQKVIIIMAMLLQIGGGLENDRLMCVEIFAGCHSITRAFKDAGHATLALDFSTESEFDNINNSIGFVRALMAIMHLGADSLFWSAPPCSTWVFMNRGTSKRTKDDPLGDQSKKSVANANTQVSRVCLLCMVAILLHNCFIMAEQPASSLFEYHPRWELLQHILGDSLQAVRMAMQPYGAESLKPTLLYGNFGEVDTTYRYNGPLPSAVRRLDHTIAKLISM